MEEEARETKDDSCQGTSKRFRRLRAPHVVQGDGRGQSVSV